MTIKQTKRRSRLLGRGLGAAVLALVSTSPNRTEYGKSLYTSNCTAS
ncbi:MAG: hypothetical protein AAF355_16155 [Myxococcota bacterium]